MSAPGVDEVLQRELEYHQRLYSGFAQKHFARPAVRALREHMVGRILGMTGAGRNSRVLSLGCGIGDTELLLAPHVGEVAGVDISPAAIQQARRDAEQAGVRNAHFEEGSFDAVSGPFDAVIAIFFLHHLPDALLERTPGLIRSLLKPGGVFYSLDPSRYRLSGFAGELLFPKLMARYQTPDERQLQPSATADLFRRAGFRSEIFHYDFLSSPLAGIAPGWRLGYRAARILDEALVRTPGLNKLGSNFEIVARV